MLNKSQFIGHVGRDPEIRTFQSGDKCASFTLATSENWTDKTSGEKKSETQWHRIEVFGNLVKLCENYVRKGSKIYVEGQLKYRTYTDKEGNEKQVTEIVLNNFNGLIRLLDAKGDNKPRTMAEEAGEREQELYEKRGNAPQMPDDEIPF